MRKWRSRLENVVWTAVFAVVFGIAGILSGVFGDSQPLTQGIVVFGLILATLATKS